MYFLSKLLPVVFILFVSTSNAQTEKIYSQEEAFKLIDQIEPTPFKRTTDNEAQWFPKAGFGLFIHWGIHSVACLDPSWAMLKNCPWLKNDRTTTPDRYYNLASQFDPVNYDPEKWVLAAKNAGFQYIVITAKHHDGYCLWPSKYSKWSTGNYLAGRDLLKPYVDACREHGLKVGLYFSPRDWGNPKYPFQYKDSDYNQRVDDPMFPPKENQERFDEFFKFTIGELSEILTNYGKIDVLWFDGVAWPGVDTHSELLHAWLRTIQPGMVINPRWETNDDLKTFGDFKTEEISWRKYMEEGRPYNPGVWWEFNETWSGHWGYSPLSPFRDFNAVIKALVYARSYGGNYLPDIGPQPDGRMRSEFYDQCIKLSKWMIKNKESVIGTTDFPDWNKISSIPLTRSGNIIYAHLLKESDGKVLIDLKQEPKEVILLTTGDSLPFKYHQQRIELNVPDASREYIDDVVKLVFSE